MKLKPLSKIIASCIVGTIVCPTITFAEGAIQGRLSDAGGRLGLEGALVSIPQLQLKTTSSRDGSFEFQALPAGTYTVKVDYIGSNTLERQVIVRDDAIAIENFQLQSLAGMEDVLVIGQAASLNKALNKQRAADSIMSIVNADAIGQYPDANTSEALQRLPGISVENDQGEARFVRVRGLGANFNSVTINGSKVPSPEAGDRAVALDVVPSELLQSLEVSKTLTPDMDADSLGGTINVKSLSAFDRDGLFYKVTAETNYDDHTGETSPKFSLTGSNVFGEKENFGVAGAISWFERSFGSDNIETGGSWDFDDPVRLEEFEQRDYTITRERLGVSLNFDYKPTESTDLYLRSLYSEYSDSELRLANVAEIYQFERDDEGNIIEDDEGDPEVIDGIPAGERGAATIARELKDRTETLKIQSIVLGGSSRVNSWTIDYKAGFSESSEDTPYNVDGAVFEAEFDEGVGYSAGEVIRPNYPSEVFDADEYELDEIETAATFTEDSENNISLDVEKLFNLKDASLALKFGAKISQREKVGDEDVWVFEGLDEEGFSDSQLLLSSYTGSAIEYQFGNMGDRILTSRIIDAISPLNRDDFVEEVDSAVADYQINEDINAAYVMATVDLANWRILAGLRHEATEFEANGMAYNEYELDDVEVEEIVATQFSNDYSHTLPALHLRYSFNDKTQLRAAWTNSVVRPTFEQLSPGKVREGDEVEFGNPLLDPLESSNFDLGIEHYAGFASYVSAFVFYKDIENFVYEIDLGPTADPSIVGPGEIGEAATFENGDSAEISGIELAASKQFSNLPEPWNGLLISANTTWTDSEARITYLDDESFIARDLAMPSQSDFSGNLALGYEGEKLNLRIAANYKSEYLLEITDPEDAMGDIWVDSQLSLDFLARWNINDSLQVFFQGVNLVDEPYYAYIGNKRYNAQYEEYGATYRMGISLSHF
jgi:TonB-dependent receptor